MYENIRKAIAAHEAETLAKFNAEIETKTAAELLGSGYYQDLTTPKILKALKATGPDERPAADILDRIKAKKARKEAKRTAERLEKLAAAEAAAVAPSVDISVEFRHSRTWGWNPHATVRAWATVTEDSASGYGYNKESSAIAGAMNTNPEIMRILYDHAETGEPFLYSVYTFAGLPFFNGECGVSGFRSVFEACGYEWRQIASGRTFNAYTITRKQ